MSRVWRPSGFVQSRLDQLGWKTHFSQKASPTGEEWRVLPQGNPQRSSCLVPAVHRGRTPILSPAYDFVATIPYISGDSLGLSFGGSKKLDGISLDQVRRFADTAGLPMKPVWDVVQETIEKTMVSWRTLSSKDLLPEQLLDAINTQIEKASTGIGRT